MSQRAGQTSLVLSGQPVISSRLSFKRKQTSDKSKQHGPPHETDNNDNGIEVNAFCPLCQMPRDILQVQPFSWHLEECMAVDRSKQKECARGINCDSTIVNHYLKETHFNLARSRSGCESCTVTSTESETLDGGGGGPSSKKAKIESYAGDTDLENLDDREITSSTISRNEKTDHNHNVPASQTSTLKQHFEVSRSKTATEVVEYSPVMSQLKITRFFGLSDTEKRKSTGVQCTTAEFSAGSGHQLKKPSNLQKSVQSKMNVETQSEIQNKCSGGSSSSFNPSGSTSGTAPKFQSNYGRQAYTSNYTRTCPFYKRLMGSPFVVDAFSYGEIPGITAYFLSHFHQDHYEGLNARFQKQVYCSEITAQLVKLKIRMDERYIRALSLNTPHVIQDVEVTLIDANHCPGSVMFVFRYRDGKVMLHTGDFRATPEMLNHPALASVNVDILYLDTTYCQPQYDFPSQDDVVEFAVDLAKSHVEAAPHSLIVCGSYTIGKERVFMAISKALKAKIFGCKDKICILKCLQDEYLQKMLTSDKHAASVHVLKMNELKFQTLRTYLNSFNGTFTHVLALKPTGWEHGRQKSCYKLQDTKPMKQGNITIYGIPYSEHSSFGELKQFVQLVKPKRVIPTVNVTGAKSSGQKAILDSWTSQLRC